MAKNGFKLIDAEMHVMEPVDLWERYIDPEFATRAPRRSTSAAGISAPLSKAKSWRQCRAATGRR
jgi:hypothetical protein